MRAFRAALSGDLLLALPQSCPLEEARIRLADELLHPVWQTHLLQPGTGQALTTEDAFQATGAVCEVLLLATYRVRCHACGRGIECSCPLAGARGCQCATSALPSDSTALCLLCDYREEEAGAVENSLGSAGDTVSWPWPRRWCAACLERAPHCICPDRWQH